MTCETDFGELGFWLFFSVLVILYYLDDRNDKKQDKEDE